MADNNNITAPEEEEYAIPSEPLTREEKYLNAIVNNTSGSQITMVPITNEEIDALFEE